MHGYYCYLEGSVTHLCFVKIHISSKIAFVVDSVFESDRQLKV